LTAETNVERARRGYEAARRGDMSAVEAFLDPEVKWHGGDPQAEGACVNRKQALSFMGQAVAAGRIGELVDVVDARDDRVVVVMRRHVPGGEEVVANVTTFRDGRAVEIVHYPSVEEALAVAGVARSGEHDRRAR